MIREQQTSTVTRPSSSVLGDDYERFCRAIRTLTGIDLASYKRGQMERRIRAMAERSGISNLQEYGRLLGQDAQQLRQFLDRVTINVSELFRNPEKFEELRLHILPTLLRRKRTLSIWSAGCSYGAEVYSLAILLHQLGAGHGHHLLASDIDRGILERAKQGIFSEEDMKNVPSALQKRYFTLTTDGYQVGPLLQGKVEFRHHDLLRDDFPRNIDLILCRNVVIYFSDDAKSRLFSRFYQALAPDGILLIGSTERIANAHEIGYNMPRPFFYQRPG